MYVCERKSEKKEHTSFAIVSYVRYKPKVNWTSTLINQAHLKSHYYQLPLRARNARLKTKFYEFFFPIYSTLYPTTPPITCGCVRVHFFFCSALLLPLLLQLLFLTMWWNLSIWWVKGKKVKVKINDPPKKLWIGWGSFLFVIHVRVKHGRIIHVWQCKIKQMSSVFNRIRMHMVITVTTMVTTGNFNGKC